MTEGLKPYPAYKPSGVPWLGDVPEHWEIERLKARAANIIEQTDRLPSGEIYVALEHVESWTGRLREAGVAVAFDSQVKRFQSKDVLFGKLRPYLAKVARPNREGVCVGEFFVLRSRTSSVNADYLAHLLRSKPTIDVVNSSTFGAKMPRADWGFVGNLRLSFPPLPEQSAVVRFLDYFDRRIRKYIRAKQKLIGLLNEQKQDIVHKAVTRGLNPNVKFKPSGVPWLGDVPEHWGVRRTKVQFRLRTEKSGMAHGRELLSVYTHIGVRPRRELVQKGNKASTTDDYWVVKKGDIVANKLLAWMGAIGVSHYDGVTSPAYDILMPIVNLVPDYYHHLFRTKLYLQRFKQHSRGIMDMRLRLYFDQFGQILVPVPPYDEQAAIVEFYNDATADTDRLIEQTQHEISLLREYRTRLVSDVVTGKLDVREAAADLPEEAGETESADVIEADVDDIEDSVSETEAGDGEVGS